MADFAREAGLRETDMPSDHHPLMENDDEVRELSDLIDVRTRQSDEDRTLHEVTNANEPIDIENALTFPHKKPAVSSTDLLPELTDFDADARGHSPPDDEDDASYMTRADVEDSMALTDPDPNTGMDETIGDAGLDRAPDITGTVQGIGRGFSTHLPQDIGAGGFQIEEVSSLQDPRADENDALMDDEEDGGIIPTAPVDVDTRDDALDATRRLK